MLPSALTLALLSVPAPPQCPWMFGQIESLMPNGVTVPINASFWLRSYVQTVDFSIIDYDAGETITFDRTEIDLSATGGKLIELRPNQPLRPNRSYELREIGSGSRALVQVLTSSAVDLTRPAVPDVIGTRPISSPYEICQTAGIIIDVADPGEPVIHLIEGPGDDTLELGASGSIYLQGNRVVPTDPNETVRFEVFALDFAGNRSAATPATDATAGPLPEVQGKFFGPPEGDSFEAGCDCNTAPAGSASWPLLFAVLLRAAGRRSPFGASRPRRAASSSPPRARDPS